jgi:hypothetical protein
LSDEILYVKSRRAARVKRAQTAQHVGGAILLLSNGYRHLQHGHSPLAYAEVAAGALLIGAVLLEKFRHRHESGIAWVELAGAAMLFVEAIEKTHQKHHMLFYVLSFVQPLIFLAFALFDAQIAQRRSIRMNDDGIDMRLRLLFNRRPVAWKEIAAFRVLDDRIDFGRRSISLRDVVDRDEAKRWLTERLRERGVEELPAQELPGGDRGA